MVVLEPGGAQSQQAGGIDLRGHVGQLPLDGLKFADGAAELLSLAAVLERAIVGAGGHAEAQGGNRDASAVENAHGIDKALAFGSEQVFPGNFAVLKDQLGGVGGAQAEFVLLLAGAKAGRAALDDEGGETARTDGFIGDGNDHNYVGVGAIGDEGLGAVEHPSVILAGGRAARAAGVRAAVGLGQRPGANVLAGGEVRKVALLLLRLPARKMWLEHSDVWAATMMPTEPSTRESSSMAMTYSM